LGERRHFWKYAGKVRNHLIEAHSEDWDG
jgi:hypothetical protein